MTDYHSLNQRPRAAAYVEHRFAHQVRQVLCGLAQSAAGVGSLSLIVHRCMFLIVVHGIEVFIF